METNGDTWNPIATSDILFLRLLLPFFSTENSKTESTDDYTNGGTTLYRFPGSVSFKFAVPCYALVRRKRVQVVVYRCAQGPRFRQHATSYFALDLSRTGETSLSKQARTLQAVQRRPYDQNEVHNAGH